MNKAIYILSSIFFILLSTSCEDDDSGCTGVDCLPLATQTGAGTFGCLVNGEPFVDNSGNFNCFYQFIDNTYFFSIEANFEDKIFRNLNIGCNSINFQNIQTFNLEISADGGGGCHFFNC